MYLFRVDNRKFAVGDVINPECNYQDAFIEQEKKDLEKILDETKAIPFSRKNALFLFQELKDALIYSLRTGNYLYAVSCSDGFRYDMNMLDSILDAINIGIENYQVEAMCHSYWKHKKTHSPCYEVMTQQAQVKAVICETAVFDQFKKEYIACNNFSVEKTSVYRDLFKKLYIDDEYNILAHLK